MKAWMYLLLILMLIISFKGAFALEVDSDDSIVLVAGSQISQSLILYNFGDNLDAVELSVRDVLGNSASSWVSLQNNGSFDSEQVYQDSVFISYDISVPEDTPVGVYRAVLEFDDGNESAYYNLKISVQNRFIAGFLGFLNTDVDIANAHLKVYHLFVSTIVLILILYVIFSIIGYGGFNGKKK